MDASDKYINNLKKIMKYSSLKDNAYFKKAQEELKK